MRALTKKHPGWSQPSSGMHWNWWLTTTELTQASQGPCLAKLAPTKPSPQILYIIQQYNIQESVYTYTKRRPSHLPIQGLVAHIGLVSHLLGLGLPLALSVGLVSQPLQFIHNSLHHHPNVSDHPHVPVNQGDQLTESSVEYLSDQFSHDRPRWPCQDHAP